MAKSVKMGLTGGIGSGKSEVGRLLLEKGIPVIDMDKIGKGLLESDPQIKKEIQDTFGEKAVTGNSIDRLKLRNLIFTNSANRKQLEQIVQPRIRKEFERQAMELESQGTKLIVCEAALLIESGYRHSLDKLTVVLASEKIRMGRLLSREPISLELARKIMESQVTDKERLAVADYVIDNNGTIQSLATNVESVLSQWKKDGLF